jgi:hypothetical protein
MDLKTLDYMEERAKKGRKIVEQIENLSEAIARLKRAKGTIDLYTPNKTIRLEVKYNDHSLDDYTTRAVAEIHNTFIDITLAEIRKLEKELAEL